MYSHLQHFCPSPLDSKLLSKVSSLLPNRVIVFSGELPLITWSPQITGLLISFLPMAHGFTSETYTGFIIFGQPCFPLFRSYSEDLISIKVPPLSFSLLSFSQYLTLSLSHKFKNICMFSGFFFFLCGISLQFVWNGTKDIPSFSIYVLTLINPGLCLLPWVILFPWHLL